MRAALLTAHGGPEVLVVRDDVAVPEPAADEVLIRVAACGINNTDINTRVGWYSKAVTESTADIAVDGPGSASTRSTGWGGGLRFPRIQGADPSGRIVAVGTDVETALVGRRVLVDCCIRDPEEPTRRELTGYLGSERDGGFAEFCAVPARNAHVHNSTLSDVELASFPCSWSTAMHMLHRIRLTPGERLLVTGASGGVGSALVSLAALRGAVVTASCSPSKAEAVRALGTSHVVNRAADDLHARAVAANGGPFDAVADIVGGSDTPGWFESLRRGGRYVTSGAIAGPVVDLDLRTLYLNDLEFHGATIYESQVFADLVDIIERGKATPVVGGVFDLADITEAQRVFQRKEHVGSIVLTI